MYSHNGGGGGGGGGGGPIFANLRQLPELVIFKFRGGNSKFGINWQKLAKIIIFLGYRFLALGRG